MTRSAIVLVAVTGLAWPGAARQSPPAAQAPATQAPATFRSAIDVIQLDVSVLDHDRHPVRGLTEKDFTLFEDGTAAPVVAFSAVDLPDPVETRTEWKRTSRPDVATNEIAGRRLVVIVIDDAQLRFKPSVLVNARRIATEVIDRLGPEDVATVVFTRDNRAAQDFTTDRARLLAAMNKMTLGMPDKTYYALSAFNTIENVGKVLIEAPEQRKMLVFISTGMPFDIEAAQAPQLMRGPSSGGMGDREDVLALVPARDRLFTAARKANVNVYAFDPCGLRPAALSGPNPDACMYDALQIESLLTIANGTGGHATINTDDFGPGVEQMFLENGSYYILGYKSSHPADDGSARRIVVRVNRPGLMVRTRNLYDADSAKVAARAVVPPSAAASIAGILPSADLPMRATLVPFASPTQAGKVMVAIALGLEAPVTATRTIETIDLIASAFDPEGKLRGSQTQQSQVTLRAGALGTFAKFEVVSQITLAPGRYRLRLGAHSPARKLGGSVHIDVDVPDFAKAPLSLSGIVLTKEPPLKSAQNGLGTLLPIAPTTVREFNVGDRVTGLVRVYRGSANGNRPPPRAPISMRLRILDARDGEAFTTTAEVVVARSGPMYAADYRFEVPLRRLSVGDHLLVIEAQIDQTTRVERSVPFTVR